MMKKLRQLFCNHWWEVQAPFTYEAGMGAIIAGQQKQFNVTTQTRSCWKCGAQETRRIGEPEFVEWS